MKLLILATLLAMVGCATFKPYGGISAHPKQDEPEVNLSTGLGFVGAEMGQWGDARFFCEHISGLQTSEIGAGLNHCGVVLRKD